SGGNSASQTMGCVLAETSIALAKTVIIEGTPVVSTGGIKILKTNSATNKPLAGAEFLISQSESFAAPAHTLVANAQGIAEKTGLAVGTWYIKETKTPPNYMTIADVIVVSVGTATTEINIKNTPYSTIKIVKVDEGAKAPARAVFDIYEGKSVSGTPLFKNLKSDANGLILQGNLPAGEYTIVETAAPVGYVKATAPITVTILVGETKEVKFVNTAAKARMHIFKYDSISKVQLAGAVYEIYSDAACTKKLASVTTAANAPSVVDNLNAGTYYVKETQVPTGYLLDDRVKTVVLKQGETAKVDFYNTRSIPTAGNYSATLLVGTWMLGASVLGWTLLLIYKKRKNNEVK
ncbi:MAG: SpaA isopeptide-forming pilin-related protein, partial [Oscillospiraceae bacterium]